MKKILIGYDTSAGSEKALDIGIELAGKLELELIIMFVRSKYDRNFIKENDITETEIKNQIKEMMKRTITTIIRSDIKVEGVILKGDVAQKIMEYSEENDVDLIILGAVGISEIDRYKLGSVAEKVMRYSKKPVLIAR